MDKTYNIGELAHWMLNRRRNEGMVLIIAKGGGRYNILLSCGRTLWVHPRHLMKIGQNLSSPTDT